MQSAPASVKQSIEIDVALVLVTAVIAGVPPVFSMKQNGVAEKNPVVSVRVQAPADTFPTDEIMLSGFVVIVEDA